MVVSSWRNSLHLPSLLSLLVPWEPAFISVSCDIEISLVRQQVVTGGIVVVLHECLGLTIILTVHLVVEEGLLGLLFEHLNGDVVHAVPLHVVASQSQVASLGLLVCLGDVACVIEVEDVTLANGLLELGDDFLVIRDWLIGRWLF